MAEINNINCGEQGQFVHSKGGANFGRTKWVILSRKGTDILTTAQLATAEASLLAKMQNNNWRDQIFMVGPFVMPENNGEAVAYETIGIYKARLHKGTKDDIFTLQKGSLCDRAMLNRLADRNWDNSYVDEKNLLKIKETATGVKGFASHAFEVLPEELITESAGAKVKVRVAIENVDDWNENASHIDLGFDIGELNGVETFVITNVTPDGAADGVHDFAIRSICPDCNDGENNMNQLYATELQTTSIYAPLNHLGAALTITSIAQVLDSDGVCIAHRFTMSLADTDYIDGQVAKMKFASISTVKATLTVAATQLAPVAFTMQEA